MKKVLILSAVIALLGLSILAHADVFGIGVGLANLETVTVGDPGNDGELSGLGAGGKGPDGVCGTVNYTYRIGKYEVTAGQYTAFLNAIAATDTYGLYNKYMSDPVNHWGCNIQRSGSNGHYRYSVAPDWANRPVNYVTYWNACRFANWLHNGQRTGPQNAWTTERGAYTLDGYNGPDGRKIQRNGGWKWAVASEDEWYKAAYYKGGGTDAGYWDYPTQSDKCPINILGNQIDPGNTATYYDHHHKTGNGGFTTGDPYYRTEVGAHSNSKSAYGTFDQAGNIREWVEVNLYGNAFRGLRSGCFRGYSDDFQANYRGVRSLPTIQCFTYGFRVVAAVP